MRRIMSEVFPTPESPSKMNLSVLRWAPGDDDIISDAVQWDVFWALSQARDTVLRRKDAAITNSHEEILLRKQDFT